MVRALTKNASNTNSPNLIINGAMDFAQRGTSVLNTTTGKVYMIDRWATFTNGSSPTPALYCERMSTGPVGFRYSLMVRRNSGNANTSGGFLSQGIESSNIIPYRGKNMVLSFYAMKGANYSPTSSILSVFFQTGTGVDEDIVSTYTGQVSTNMEAVLTTSWQRFELPVTIASDVSEARVFIRANHIGTAGADDSFSVTGVMLSEGTKASTFQRAGASIGDELMLCQRYFEKSYLLENPPGNNTSTNIQQFGYNSAAASGTVLKGTVYFKTEKRSAPSVVVYRGVGTPNEGDGFNNADSFAGGFPASVIAGTNAVRVSITPNVATVFSVRFHWAASAEL